MRIQITFKSPDGVDQSLINAGYDPHDLPEDVESVVDDFIQWREYVIIELDTETEFVAGFDDKHQNFRVSVISQSGWVYLATWVHPNNIGGRIYLFTILPFHVMIARDALKRVALQS